MKNCSNLFFLSTIACQLAREVACKTRSLACDNKETITLDEPEPSTAL